MTSHHQSLLNQLGGINLEDPPEATPEADADAARLLNRALVVNRLGGAVSWEETLAKLGVIEERMGLAEMRMGVHDVVDTDASMMNGFDAYMDSTKRKRRKKMKKHKLKKRRRVRFLSLFPLTSSFYLTPPLPPLVATVAEDQDWQIDLNRHELFSRYYFLNSRYSSTTTASHHLLARRKYT